MKKGNVSIKSDDFNKSDLFLRKMIIVFLVIASIIFTCFSVLFIHFKVTMLQHIMPFYALQHIVWLSVYLSYYKNREVQIEPVIWTYLSFILVALYPIVCIYWNSGSPIIFFWYLLIPIGAMLFQVRKILIWVISTFVSIISILLFSSVFFKNVYLPETLILFSEQIIIIATIVLIAFFALILLKKNSSIASSSDPENSKKTLNSDEEMEKYKNMYNYIVNYLNENQPYKNPNFNVAELANALHTNVNYISKAIKAGNNTNFNTLLNTFRINYVKSMIDSDAMKKYTIDYIYTEAGYRYRSTFNYEFKHIVGMTPSNYVAKTHSK